MARVPTMPTFRRILIAAALLLAVALCLSPASQAQAYETRAGSAWVYDLTTDTVLLEKNADVPMPPASMSKLMTLNMLFEALRDGRVGLDTRFSVSSRAKAMGGSTMFLDETDRPTVEDLIKGIIVQSGNDACVVVAEALAGSEEAFARLMTERAAELGMTQSTFANASGWPDPRHRMSMQDLGLLAVRLITEFPEFYPYFAMQRFEFDGRAPANVTNRNPLLGLGIGADGLKTGHTREAGYGLVGSAMQGDRRVVFVISGLDSDAARRQESESLVNWAFRQFVRKTVARAGAEIVQAPVFLGAADSVPLTLAEDLTLLIPAMDRDGLMAQAVFDGPLEAPVTAGQTVGELVVSVPDLGERRLPLVTAGEVAKGGFMVRMEAAAQAVAARISAAIGS